MPPIERITQDGQLLGLVVRAGVRPAETTFLTEPEHPFQLGHIVYGAGHAIPRHLHRPIERTVGRSAEVLLIQQGRCELDLYDDARALVATVTLGVGDVVLLLAGGHAFRMLEDTVMLEVKQGPYPGPREKEAF